MHPRNVVVGQCHCLQMVASNSPLRELNSPPNSTRLGNTALSHIWSTLQKIVQYLLFGSGITRANKKKIGGSGSTNDSKPKCLCSCRVSN